jgi:hypothetical protein
MPILSRRDFVARVALSGGALAVPSLIASGCNEDTIADPTQSATLNFSSDAGVLNYFYAITQLQADFWTRVNLNRFAGILATESSAFSSFQSHATSQRNWLQLYQTNGRVTDAMTFGFASAVDFASRASTMTAGYTIEDSATQAYAGAAKYLQSPAKILLAAKLASIAARHSATIRDLNDLFVNANSRTSFAGDDIVSASGLETAKNPSDIMATLSQYYKTQISVSNA